VAPSLPDIAEWPTTEKLAKEKEMLGFYISGHPLDKYRNELIAFTTSSVSNLSGAPDGREVTVAGILTTIKKKTDKKGNLMAFVTMEDYTGSVELIVFSDCYQKSSAVMEVDRMILVTGRVSTREGEPTKIVASEIVGLEQITEKFRCQLVIRIEPECAENTISEALSSLSEFQGKVPVLLAARENGSEVYIRSKRYFVTPDFELLNRLKELLGNSAAYLRPM
jgi:DNA polymerase-3 subunit alpha